MNWANLKKNRCPECGSDFVKSMVRPPEGHILCRCGFLISEQKYKEVTSDRVIREIREREERVEVPEGFGLLE